MRRVTIESRPAPHRPHARRAVSVGDIVSVEGGSKTKVAAIDKRTSRCLVVHGDTGKGAIYPLGQVRRIDAWWNRETVATTRRGS